MKISVPILKYEEVTLSKEQINKITINSLKEAWAKQSSDLSPFMWIKDGKVYREEGDYHSEWDVVVREATEEEINSYNAIQKSIALLNN